MVSLEDSTDLGMIKFIFKILSNNPMAFAVFDNIFCEASFDTTFQLILILI